MAKLSVKISLKNRILVVDDHPLFRSGVVELINRQADMKCCGEAYNGATAVTAVVAHNPDLVLLDLRLGSGDGIELIKSLKSQFPSLRILVVSQFDETLYAERALRAGALGYVMKEQAADVILNAMRAVLAGNIHASQAVTSLILHKMIQVRAPVHTSDASKLTDRELHVLQLLGGGISTREIASKLNLSFKTIESHRENIKHKLGLHSAGELLRYASMWSREQSFPLPRPAPREHLPPAPGDPSTRDRQALPKSAS